MKKIILFFFVAGIVFATSCKKELTKPNDDPANQDLTKIEVPATFDWKTTGDFQISLTGNTDGIVTISSASGIVYLKAFLKQDQPYTTKLTVPAYETSVELRFNGKVVAIALTSETISYQFN